VDLRELGWNQTYLKTVKESQIKDLIPRIVATHSGKHYKILTQDRGHSATLSNYFLNALQQKSEIPAVRDWVGLQKNHEIHACHIRYVYLRKNMLSRKVAGTKAV
jgi:putative ribosome biogenesis GTPase RsgA